MWKKGRFFSLLIVACALNLYAHPIEGETFLPLSPALEAVRFYEGDRHGQFIDDDVAILTDGSEWKIHPKDTLKFGAWRPKDSLRVALRKSFYWFKREHKFELIHEARGESVRVMLVKYPAEPLVILNTSIKIIRREKFKHSTRLEIAQAATEIYWWRHFYLKTLQLSDGSFLSFEEIYECEPCWEEFPKSPDPFVPGLKVYLGYDKRVKSLHYFIISGLERDARWKWVERASSLAGMSPGLERQEG